MARKYSKSASKDVERAMRKKKRGTLKSGRSGKTVKAVSKPSPSGYLRPVKRAKRFLRRRLASKNIDARTGHARSVPSQPPNAGLKKPKVGRRSANAPSLVHELIMRRSC